MDDYYYEQRRRTEALEHSNYALERQNELTELQNRINAEGLKLQAQQLALTATAAQAQIKQNERLIDLSEQQVAATYDAANASREIAATIERGQRAWAEVELAKMKRRQKKDADKEFTHEQEQKIHQLWRRESELSKPPSTPGARFMLWEEMRAARADIAIDCVHNINYLDRDHEVGVKLRDFIIALVNRYPELIFAADDYNGKIALAKRLQNQTFFQTFTENGDANMLMMLRKKFPELNIPNCDTYPQKSFNFIQDVARLKNLCALLGDAVAKDKEIQGIIITAFNLDSAVFGEEKWATVIAGELSPFEANYYYRFYRNHKTYDSATPADALQRILEPLAKCLKIDVDSVARLRRVEQAKHKEIANVDGEIESIIAAKRRAEEEKERERRRQEEEIRRRKEEERRRVEEERNRQRLQAMKENLIDALF